MRISIKLMKLITDSVDEDTFNTHIPERPLRPDVVECDHTPSPREINIPIVWTTRGPIADIPDDVIDNYIY